VPNIAVIGAGLAGLTAAYRLQEQGYDVHVYEAHQRPGGRVLTAKVGEGIEELGGKNFNDAGNPVHSLALIQELGLTTHTSELPINPFYVSGMQCTPFFNLLRKFKEPEDFLNQLEQTAKHSQTLQDVIDATFKDPDLHESFTGLMRGYEGTEPTHLDATCYDTLHTIFSLFYEAMKETDANYSPPYTYWLTLKGGNAQLPLALAERLKGKLYYGKALTALRQENKKLTLTFNANLEVQADRILFAIPCSVFKDIDFGPETIPSDTLHRIQTTQYGTNGKILFAFSESLQEHKFIISPTHVSWSNAEDTVRTLYFGGETGIFDGQKAQSLFKDGLKMIHTVYPDLPLKSYFIEPVQDIQFAIYKDAVFISWIHDPYAKGSYTNRAPGTAVWLNEIETIHGEQVRKAFRPINDTLFFAGEHTTTLDVFGTMEGAIESGERMARLMGKTIKS